MPIIPYYQLLAYLFHYSPDWLMVAYNFIVVWVVVCVR
jgi:hypothetical protein